MKRIYKEHFIMFIAAAAITLTSLAVNVFAFDTEEQMKRYDELLNMGLPSTQLWDQVAEEFYGVDGANNTGGLDGKLLDGSIAPNGILAGTSSGSSGGNTGSTSKPSHSHDYKETSRIEPTCTADGTITYTCDCGKTKSGSIEKLPHDMSVLVGSTNGTCVDIGTVTYKCKTCDRTETINTTYGEHIYIKNGEESVPSSCLEDGISVSYCSVCGNKVEEVVVAHGHNVLNVPRIVTSATCTADGLEEYYCGYCNTVMESKVIPALGHGEGIWAIVKEPDYLSDGEQVLLCSVCDAVLERKVLDKVNIPVYLYVVSGVAVLAIAGTGAWVVTKKKK